MSLPVGARRARKIGTLRALVDQLKNDPDRVDEYRAAHAELTATLTARSIEKSCELWSSEQLLDLAASLTQPVNDEEFLAVEEARRGVGAAAATFTPEQRVALIQALSAPAKQAARKKASAA